MRFFQMMANTMLRVMFHDKITIEAKEHVVPLDRTGEEDAPLVENEGP